MKIAVRGGHNFSVPGARAIIDETTEDRKVKDAVIKYLKAMGHTVYDVTPSDSYNTSGSDLRYGVSKANDLGVNLFISIHFNKAYTRYNGAIGTEVLVSDTSRSNQEAKGVLKELVGLGFINRGVKARPELYEIRHTNMTAMIVEVCFVEATEDVKIYRSLGYDRVGKAIAEGATGSKTNTTVDNKPVTPSKPETSANWISDLQKELNKNYGGNLDVDGIAGPKTLAACPLVKEGARGNLVTIIQKRLISLGFSCGSTGADGVFGNGTEKAVKEFQKSKSLSVDGIIGNNTWKKLLGL